MHLLPEVRKKPRTLNNGKRYSGEEKWGHTYFHDIYGCRLETGWFSFHIVDRDKICFEVSFDTVWSDNETGEAFNVDGTIYVYEKYYGKYLTRIYREYIIEQKDSE